MGGLALSAEGLPGVGKTTLAVALAYHPAILSHFSDGVLWAGLGLQPDVLSALAAWAEALESDVSGLPAETARAQAVKDAIGLRRLLLVIDDAWQLESARWLRCGGPNCAHLLTTRDKGLARVFAGAAGVSSVPTLDDDPAYELLQKLAPEACAATAPKLAQAVGGLPLALELLGGYLAAPERTYFPDLSAAALAELGDPARRLSLASQRLGSHQSAAVTLQETITLSLSGLPDAARAAFYALGTFAPKPDSFDRPAAEAVTGANAVTLALLAARNLLEIAGDQLALHQTLSDVARAGMPPEAVARHRDYYLALANTDRHNWQRIEAAYAQLKWAWVNMPDKENTLLELVWALRIHQERRGLWRDYLAWAQRGLALAAASGWRKEALRYYQQALPIREEVGDRAGLATTLNNIGAVYDNLGQRQEALRYYQRALPIQEEVGNRAELARTLNNIGLVYDNLGQRQEALSYYQRALPIYEEVGNRAELAVTLNNIGLVYDHLGQRQEALRTYQQALPITEEVGDRAGLAVTLNNIGLVYDNLGQRQEALSYYQRALPIREEVGDRDGESVTCYNLARLYWTQGTLTEAAAHLERAVELAAQVQSPYLERFKTELAQVEAELAAQGK